MSVKEALSHRVTQYISQHPTQRATPAVSFSATMQDSAHTSYLKDVVSAFKTEEVVSLWKKDILIA
jgi:hypothetical protein